MSSFYTRFGCENKEELYEKVVNKEESVHDLVDFIEFSKTQIENCHKAIKSPKDFFDYAKHIAPPTVDKAVLVFVDTKNQPVYQRRTRLSQRKEVRQSLKEGLNAGGVSMFTLVNSTSNKAKVNELVETYKIVGVEIIDQLTFNETYRQYCSEKGMESFNLENQFPKVSVKENNYDFSLMIDHHEEFVEFAPYYASNELVGKNVIEQSKEIKDNLKFGYQYLDQEVFGFIGYDENNEVITVKELFKGGKNSSIVDSRLLTKEILKNDTLKGYAIFHNHPSGIPDQSYEDENVTKRISTLSKHLEVEFLDHYIVGKKEVLSFAEKVSWFKSHNPIYQQKIDDKKEDGYVLYWYEMWKRPVDIGCQPKGFVEWDANQGRHGIVAYTRPLTEKELYDYDMKEWKGAEKEKEKKKSVELERYL